MKTRFNILIVSFIILLSNACQQSNIQVLSEATMQQNIVTIDQANMVAVAQPSLRQPKSSQARIGSIKTIRETFTKYDKNRNPLMYIINYEKGGFIIIAADNRISPVLAYSDNNSFSVDTEKMPSGLVDWFESVQSVIRKIRVENKSQDKIVRQIWDRSMNLKSVNASTITIEGDCNTSGSMVIHTEVLPLLLTTWQQGDGYNDALPYASCSTTSNGKVLTGCSATVVAQIMKYYAYPTTYNWSSMPLNTGSSATAALMSDLGLPSNLNSTYSCNNTVAPWATIPTTFQNFGYTTPSISSYNYFTVKSELVGNRPVILKGKPSGSNAHAWACDGVSHWDYYTCQPDPNIPGEMITVYTNYIASLHMNWGLWDGVWDGWYATNNFNPNGMSFNSSNEMITGIRP